MFYIKISYGNNKTYLPLASATEAEALVELQSFITHVTKVNPSFIIRDNHESQPVSLHTTRILESEISLVDTI